MKHLWIVVPAYNEVEIISEVVHSLRDAGYSLICVVDDGSDDGTGAVALNAGAHVLRHIANLGQGAALQTGITYALLQGAEYICTFDADGQHAVESIGEMVSALQRSGSEIALGSRFLGKTVGMPASKQLLLKAALFFTKWHARIDVTDTHNGLRVFTRSAAQRLRIDQPGMAHASEILNKIGTFKMRFIEVPTVVKYTKYSRSKGQSLFESVKILLDLVYQSMAVRR
jgi:polyprenyl-phospho-N-acetylgalactosaminyl synthase